MKPITIIGGGLAGLSLGLGLRKRGVPVVVWEAGQYPRHRVCGEFISGRGIAVLEQLGVGKRLAKTGVQAETARFFLGRRALSVRRLPARALSIPRFVLDQRLAEMFQESGGELRLNSRWREIAPCEGLVFATGRRPSRSTQGWRWFGLKVHARNVLLTADLEMHSRPDGYVGLSRLPGGQVNVCGLFRRADLAAGQPISSWREFIQGRPGTSLHARLAHADFENDSFCSVAGLSYVRQDSESDACCIGDALTMTPPVTGNGMSMAFEAADLATEPLVAYSRGKIGWEEARRTIAESCRTAFTRRLRWAHRLQTLMFSRWASSPVAAALLGSPWVWGQWFCRTR